MPITFPLVAAGESGAKLDVSLDGGAQIRRSVLPGGVRVITEHIPGMRSVSIGAWVPVGSRDELPEHAGSTHFLEHLLFKGTQQRSAFDIAQIFDRVGGESNALTGKEYTCYYAKVLDNDARLALEVILDMITGAKLDPTDFETERGVILEELAMNEDDASDVAHEKLVEAVLNGHVLGKPVGGTPEVIQQVSRDAVWNHYRKHYQPENLVVAIAGGVNHAEAVDWVAELLVAGGWELATGKAPKPRRNTELPVQVQQIPQIEIDRPDLEQMHVLLGMAGFKNTEEKRNTLAVLSSILGGGMSSRLFQEIREKRGLAYSVYAFGFPNAETGVYGLYAGCAPEKTQLVAELMAAELEKMSQHVTEDEVQRAQGQLSGALVLRLEDSSSRMVRLGRAEIMFGELLSIDESLDNIAAVTVDQVMDLAAELLRRPRSQVLVGPLGRSR